MMMRMIRMMRMMRMIRMMMMMASRSCWKKNKISHCGKFHQWVTIEWHGNDCQRDIANFGHNKTHPNCNWRKNKRTWNNQTLDGCSTVDWIRAHLSVCKKIICEFFPKWGAYLIKSSFLDTQMSLAPTLVRCKSVGPSHFQISIPLYQRLWTVTEYPQRLVTV